MTLSAVRRARLALICLLIATLGVGAATAQRRGPIRVLVDQTREYSSEWMTLGDTLPAAEFLVTQSFASVSGQPLDAFDVLVVRYDTKDTVWSAPMTELVKRFVRTGGGLLLIAHGGHWYMGPSESAEHPIYQANRLASAFDFRFEIEADKLEVRGELAVSAPSAQQEITQGIDTYTLTEDPGSLTDITGSAYPIVSSAGNQLVIAARGHGRGRVVACSDPKGLVPGGPNDALLRNLLTWLKPTESRPDSSPPQQLVLPSVTHRFREVGVAIPAELTTGTQLLAFEMALRDVGDALEKSIGVQSRGQHLVLVLPEGTPSLIPGAYIAEGASYSDLYPVLQAAARAIAASCVTPRQLPGMFQVAWEHHWALRTLGALGYTRATAEWQAVADRFAAIEESRLTSLDPLVVPEDREAYLDVLARTVFLMEGMETRFGADFWKIIAQRNRVSTPLAAVAPMTPAEFGNMAQDVGGYEARQWLRERGVQVPDESRPYRP